MKITFKDFIMSKKVVSETYFNGINLKATEESIVIYKNPLEEIKFHIDQSQDA